MARQSHSGGKRMRRQAPLLVRVLDYCFGGFGYVLSGIILVLFVAIFAWMLAYYLVPAVGELPTTPLPPTPAAPVEQGGATSIFATTLGILLTFAIIVGTPLIFGWVIWWFTKAYSRVVHGATRRVFGDTYSMRHLQFVKVLVFAAGVCAVYAVNLLLPATIFFTIFLGAVVLLIGALMSVALQTFIAALARRQARDLL